MGERVDRNPEDARRWLIERSLEDEGLRQRLLDDPRKAVEQELGARVPEEVEIRVVEETPETVYLVLPPRAITTEDGELSERDLETVAGGYGPVDQWTWQFSPTVVYCDERT